MKETFNKQTYNRLDKQRDVIYKQIKAISPTYRTIVKFPTNTTTGRPFTRLQWRKEHTGLMRKVDKIDDKIWRLLHNGQPSPLFISRGGKL
jgi:hypothetical protein